MPRYNSTERAGVNAVESIFINELGWIFREQPIADMGIDAHVELLVDGNPKGKLLALQIKTGSSNFHETADAFIYYGDEIHLDYWTNHSLPVVLVAHIPDTKETYWVHVEQSKIEKTKKGWKIAIPKSSKLNEDAKLALGLAFAGSPREQKLRELTLQEPLMRHVASGKKVSVEIEDWYNKSLSRSVITVYVYDEHGNETVEMEWLQYWTRHTIVEIAEKLFPWSTASLDVDFYEENGCFDLSDDDLLGIATDEDNGITHEGRTFGDVFPYSDENGEVAAYRLKLNLNELGEAYLKIAEYLESGD